MFLISWQGRVEVRRGIALACSLWIAGCDGQEWAQVSGRVSFVDQPLMEGLIQFRPVSKTDEKEFSTLIVAGQYRVPAKVTPGNYTVEIRSWKKTGRLVKGQFNQEIEETVIAVPQRYWGPQTTLAAHLQPGENQVNFDLERK